jgi:hypothetical protein
MKARKTSLALAAALFAMPAAAYAQEIGGVSSTGEPQLGAREGLGGARPYWESGKSRWFFATVFDFAAVNYRAEMDVGYGKPHFRWAGLELTPQISLAGAQTFAGLRFVVPGIAFRTGARYFASADRRLLEPREMYTREQINLTIGPRARYLALDAELSFDIPLPVGVLSTLAAVEWLEGVPEPFNVFDQQLRIVVDPPLAWRARTAYLVPVGNYDTMQMGGLLELVGVPRRDEVMVRVGPAITVALTHHLDAIAAAAFSIKSKDDIGLQSADFGQISLRYRWASGDRWPEFP